MKIPEKPPSTDSMLKSLMESEDGAVRFVELAMARHSPTPGGNYTHWDRLRWKAPPQGFSLEEWWLAIKMARRQLTRELPLKDGDGVPFVYAKIDAIDEMCHRIDRDAAGAIPASDLVTSPHTRNTYIMRSLIEEAITSSQLEGASTTREVAKEMIQTGREPRDLSERMIVNNYRAMTFVRDIKAEPLTPAIVFELHKLLTHGTLSDPAAAGRFRRDDEQIRIMDRFDEVLFTPPRATELPERLRLMCDFANNSAESGYMHPVVRSILLHFWLAHDHPFVDGNGRTARALFYWSMAHYGYWLCEYLSISNIIRKKQVAYGRSFLYAKTDDNDATYFIVPQLKVITQAIDGLHEYLQNKTRELHETKQFLEKSRAVKAMLNHRQLTLIDHALKSPYYVYTIESHRTSHGISYHTARSDLLKLAELGLLLQEKVGHALHFIALPDLRSRLQALGQSVQRTSSTIP